MTLSAAKNIYTLTRLIRLGYFFALLAFALNTQAQQQIIIPVGQQAAATQLPKQGMTDKAVIRQFGEPLRIHGPNGQPPITRWFYDDFSVYFESGFVLHSVSTFKRTNTIPIIIEED